MRERERERERERDVRRLQFACYGVLFIVHVREERE